MKRAGHNREVTGPDRSAADIWLCYFALKNGFSKEEKEGRLLAVSDRARERVRGRDRGYARVTVDNAAHRLAYNQ